MPGALDNLFILFLGSFWVVTVTGHPGRWLKGQTCSDSSSLLWCEGRTLLTSKPRPPSSSYSPPPWEPIQPWTYKLRELEPIRSSQSLLDHHLEKRHIWAFSGETSYPRHNKYKTKMKCNAVHWSGGFLRKILTWTHLANKWGDSLIY